MASIDFTKSVNDFSIYANVVLNKGIAKREIRRAVTNKGKLCSDQLKSP